MRANQVPLSVSVPVGGRLAYDLGRDASYRAAERGDLPCIRAGRKMRVPTAKLAELLGVTLDQLGERLAVLPHVSAGLSFESAYQCEGINGIGERCRCRVMRGKNVCHWHSREAATR